MRYVVIILLLHHSLCGFAQSGTNEKILATELRRFDAMVQKDTASLRNLLADDLIYLHSNSMKENKQEHLLAIGSGKVVYEKMNRENPKIRRYGKIAIINGIVRVKGLLNTTSFELNLAYTSIYKKHKKQWQLVNWQSTRIP